MNNIGFELFHVGRKEKKKTKQNLGTALKIKVLKVENKKQKDRRELSFSAFITLHTQPIGFMMDFIRPVG